MPQPAFPHRLPPGVAVRIRATAPVAVRLRALVPVLPQAAPQDLC